MSEREEVRPPWIVYPGHDFGEGFFRQGEGNTWMEYIWSPYWDSLNEEEQEAYLKRWNVPEGWSLKFNKEFQHALKTYMDGKPPLPPSTYEGIGDGYGINKVIRRIKDFLGMRPARTWEGEP